MNTSNLQNSPNSTFEKLVDTIIRLGVLFLLIGWCINILNPFVLILIWAIVISIAIYPVYRNFVKLFRGKEILTAVVLVLLMLSILIIPSVLVTESLVAGIKHIRDIYNSGHPLIPPPAASTANWPVFAQPIVDFWHLASENLQGAMIKYTEQMKVIGSFLFAGFASIGMGILHFVASIIISGVLLAYSDALSVSSNKIFIKLAGKHGEVFSAATITTVRSVVKGILGVAVIQAAMAGAGFFIAGVPFAGLWTVACLILAIVQVGSGPVAIPIAIYMFSVTDTVTAVILAVWLAITLVADNVLKPLLLGRGAAAPMLIVFLGAIGGFIYSGFLGLFLGAVILTIGYKLFMTWLDTPTGETTEMKQSG